MASRPAALVLGAASAVVAAFVIRYHGRSASRSRAARHLAWVRSAGFHSRLQAEMVAAVTVALECGAAMLSAHDRSPTLKDGEGGIGARKCRPPPKAVLLVRF